MPARTSSNIGSFRLTMWKVCRHDMLQCLSFYALFFFITAFPFLVMLSLFEFGSIKNTHFVTHWCTDALNVIYFSCTFLFHCACVYIHIYLKLHVLFHCMHTSLWFSAWQFKALHFLNSKFTSTISVCMSFVFSS